MKKEPWEWDLGDLQNLIGQSESLRLEFKRSKVLELGSDKLASDFSKAVSAFANTEGGTIVIGVQERKQGKSRVADSLDNGISFSQLAPETLQQIIESNISPPLPRLRFRVIRTIQPELYYMVIYVPQGSTAYQAKDCLYYGRSEYEAKPLRDHEIRLRMLRGKTPDATLQIMNPKAEVVLEKSKKPTAKRDDAPPQNSEQEEVETKLIHLSFDLSLKNTGEINITQFKVSFSTAPPLFVKTDKIYSFRDGRPDPRSFFPHIPGRDSVTPSMSLCVYPMDEYRIVPLGENLLSLEDFPGKGITLNWRVYLPDRLPIVGEIRIERELFSVSSEE